MANAKVIVKAESDLSKGLSKAKLELQDFGKAAQTIGSSISNMISSHAGIAALVGSVAALGSAAKACAEEYLGAARENDRFEATMKNLSKTTGVQTESLKKMADAYEQSTFFTAEAIQASGQLLLATNEISQVVFPRALKATLDLAEAMGHDVSSAASQMQRALADPETGLKALRTAGINFTDEEEELIKSLTEANKKLEAQELILQKVEERYKGVATAVADTPAGKLDAIKDTWGAIKEGIGQNVLESLDGVFTFILDKLTQIKESMEEPVEFTTVMDRVVKDGKISNDSDYATLVQTRSDISLVNQAKADRSQVNAKELQEAIHRLVDIYGLSQGEVFSGINEAQIAEVDKLINEYEKNTPAVLLLSYTMDELREMYIELEAEEKNRQTILEKLIKRGYASQSTIDRYSQSDPIYTYLNTLFGATESGGSGGSTTGESLGLGDAGSILDPQKALIDSAMSFLEKSYLSSLDAYDREIYNINQLITQLNLIDILSPFKSAADDAIESLKDEIIRIEQERAEEERKAAEELRKEQTNLHIQAQVGQAEYLKKLNEDAKQAMADYKAQQAEYRAQWEENVFAEFSRERDFDMGGLVDAFGGITDALGPVLDIINSTNPALAVLLPIIEGFVSVIEPAIDTTIAPLMDSLTEIGTALGEVFLPIFDALRPSLDMISEILRMFITPVLQILEPIIGAVVLAFDLLSPAIAAVGLVLTPLAAALEFVMDMFSYVGESLVVLGENIGIAFYNLTHWFNPKSFKTIDPFRSDAFDNFGSKMDKWFTMMENDSVVSDSVSQQIATSNATYTGATTVHMNIYQNAPVVGENGMEQFAIMIRDKFEELDYFDA